MAAKCASLEALAIFGELKISVDRERMPSGLGLARLAGARAVLIRSPQKTGRQYQ
jgi:hypothetical protein